MDLHTNGAERVTLAKLAEGDWVRVTLATDGTGEVFRTPVKHDGPGVDVLRVAGKVSRPSADGEMPGKLYRVTFHDDTVSEWRYGTTSYYRTDRPVGRMRGLATDAERQALAATDAEVDAKLAEEGGQDAADGERCDPCKGFGLVRAIGKHAGGRYKTLTGAHAAQDAGRAVDCPACHGLGLVGLPEVVTA